MVPNLHLLRKKKNSKSDKSNYAREFSHKSTPDINFTGEPVVQCDVAVVKNDDFDIQIIANKL